MTARHRTPLGAWASAWLVGLSWSTLCGMTLCGMALVAGPAAAQTLRGRVVDERGQPLPGVHVVAVGTTLGTATDEGGRYALDGLPRDTVGVVFRFVGYGEVRRVADLRRGSARLDVTLRPATLGLQAVEVTARESAQEALVAATQAVAVLERADLEALRGQSLGETLEHLPGVTTLTTGPSIAKPVVRGLHSSRLVLLNNGVPQEGQQWGGEHAPEIDPFAPDQIEVIKGAAGVLYGIGAIGGVIRLEEAPLPDHGAGGRLALNGFSNNRQGAGSLMLEGAAGGVPGLAWRVRGSYRRAGDARAPTNVLGNTAFAEHNLGASVGYARDRFSAEALVSRFQTELGIFRGAHISNVSTLDSVIAAGGTRRQFAFSYAIGLPKQTITHDVASVRLRYAWDSGDHAHLTYGLQRNHRGEYDAHGRRANPNAPAYELVLVTNSLDAAFTHRPLGGLVGTVGVSLMNQGNVNGRSGYLIPNFRALTGGVYAYEKWLPTTRWTLEAGGRFDYRWMVAWPELQNILTRTTHTYAHLSAALGAAYAFAPTWSLAANMGTGWRPPNVNELYSNGVHHGTARFERGDAALMPERSLDVSLTLRHQSRHAEAEVSAYRNTIREFVYLLEQPQGITTIRGAFPLFTYTQHDARLAGLDGSLAWHARPWLSLRTSAALLRADNLDLGQPLYGMPPVQVRGGLRLVRERLLGLRIPFAEVEVQHVARQDRLDASAFERMPPPPAYTLTHLTVGADLPLRGQTLHLTLAVHNVFDVAYRDYLSRFRYFIDEPGRNVVVRLSLPFGPHAD